MREFLETGVISPARMRAVDRNAAALGVGALQLMESAGMALARKVREEDPSGVLILCGKGNNGGDGMVAARHLQDLEPAVCYLDLPGQSRETALQLAALRHCGVELFPVRCEENLNALDRHFSSAGVILDALLGTGARSGLAGPIAGLVERANRSGARIIAADIPTPGMRANLVLSFHRPKVAGAETVGIGIPLEAECMTGPGDLTLVPGRERSAHKGAGGKVLIIGGGPYQGAPFLAGLGALRAGADIVRVASPAFEPVPELIYERLPGTVITRDHIDDLLRLADLSDVVVMGNGIGEGSHEVVREVAARCKKAVFDADALRLPLPSAEESLYTPHAGEFTRITGIIPPEDLSGRGHAVKVAASQGTILLKGPVDVISDGDRVRFNRTGTPLMTAGGTGDVLAGVAGALFCHLPAFDAACIAAYANGKAGMAVEYTRGGGLMAGELADHIPRELFRGGL
ncbi:NAD(P)H-hydrate epimerase [Methanolinea mesophila]|uniref:NAD(P)H-hydrate dehydratase n=1 Tax=Methanolinea mesophila TaxID=547055 RepID=UPI001AEB551B|nr:NAD(P)H-hydrate dehydratase [Methanolinea mesophila]MBP1929343.1 NAD(P)H-hydrate epimerase [Methanolinea mesophila]